MLYKVVTVIDEIGPLSDCMCSNKRESRGLVVCLWTRSSSFHYIIHKQTQNNLFFFFIKPSLFPLVIIYRTLFLLLETCDREFQFQLLTGPWALGLKFFILLLQFIINLSIETPCIYSTQVKSDTCSFYNSIHNVICINYSCSENN